MSVEETRAAFAAIAAVGTSSGSFVSFVPDRKPVLGSHALHGVAGDFIRLIRDDTEASEAALLPQLLAGAGASPGRGPHYLVGKDDEHRCNLFVAVVGPTAAGRKGTAWKAVDRFGGRSEPSNSQPSVDP